MSSNVTTTKAATQSLVWMVDYSAPVVETESHDAAVMPARDRDGKFAPQDRPLTARKAMNKLCKQCSRRSAAIDAMQAMEAW